MHYVYELVNQEEIVEYVGETSRPNIRLLEHTRRFNEYTYFTGRTDITLRIDSEWETRREALDREYDLKISHGMVPTERVNQFRKLARVNGGKATRSLDFEVANEIRELYKTGNYTQRTLARMYGFKTHAPINRILTNKGYIEP
tara:strand:+ start:215 stop:646 length:432 start_codon:yes stop_codon:yes gene_type:complete